MSALAFLALLDAFREFPPLLHGILVGVRFADRSEFGFGGGLERVGHFLGVVVQGKAYEFAVRCCVCSMDFACEAVPVPKLDALVVVFASDAHGELALFALRVVREHGGDVIERRQCGRCAYRLLLRGHLCRLAES